ncbi:MAG: protein kinase domain-containing protein [Planctomycetota bacterium]|jgi:serine/threonine protein kinase
MPENIIGKYRIVEKIGRGGMGIVYKGVHVSLDRLVAIKTLTAHLALDPQYLSRIMREAKILAELQHSNIVYIYDIESQGGTDYLIMEYVSGKTVAELLKEHGPFAVNRAIKIVSDVASALSHSHQRHVIHRDIKPGNIMITDDGVVKVTDFGVAKVTVGADVTHTGLIQGTPYYMSPEQARGDSDIDGRSDIYSLGIVFYQMVTGKVPFTGNSEFAILEKQIREPPVPPSVLAHSLPATYEEIILKCIAKDRANRYPTAGDFLKSLRNIVTIEDAAATEASESESLKRQEPDRTEKKPKPAASKFPPARKLTLAAISAVLLIVLFIGIKFLPDKETEKSLPPGPALRSVEMKNRQLLAAIQSRQGVIGGSEVKSLLAVKTGFKSTVNDKPEIESAVVALLGRTDVVTLVEQGTCDLLLTLGEFLQETTLLIRSNIYGDEIIGYFEERLPVENGARIVATLETIINRQYCFNVLRTLQLVNPDNVTNLAIDITGNPDGKLLAGDLVNVCITPNRKTYAMLFDVNLEGIYLLFPRFGKEHNLLTVGKTICSGDIEVSPPTGNELLLAIAVSDHNLLSDYQYQVSRDQPFHKWSFGALGPDNAVRLCERLLSNLSNTPVEKWSAKSLFIKTYD